MILRIEQGLCTELYPNVLFYFETGSYQVTQAGFILAIFLSQLLEVWDYKWVPSCPFSLECVLSVLCSHNYQFLEYFHYHK